MQETLKFKGKENTDISVIATNQLIELILDDRSVNDFSVIFLYWDEWDKIADFLERVRHGRNAKIRDL